MENATKINISNFIESSTDDCWIDGVDISNPRSSARQGPLLYIIIHCYFVCVIGTLCNVVALWCIASCKTISSSVKILLGNIFLVQLLNSLVTQPIFAESLRSTLLCYSFRMPKALVQFNDLVYRSWALIGLTSMAVVSIVRVKAVLSTQHQQMRLRLAFGIAAGIWVYCFLASVVQYGSQAWGFLEDKYSERVIFHLYFALNFTPIIITPVCYIIMLIAIQRNKRRMAIHNSSKTTPGFDPASQAVFAICISNLLLSFPHGVYHLLPNPDFLRNVIFHVLYWSHFIVDPVVFVYFNRDYRKKIKGIIWPTSIEKDSNPASAGTNEIPLTSVSSQNL